MRDWLDQAGIQPDYLGRLDERIVKLDARAGRTRVIRPRIPAQSDDALDGRRLGQPVSDRTFAYAPTNEFGVAMWFGAVAKQLGFQILSVHPNFPDFTAVRCGPDGYWRTVDGELKFVSSGYREDYASGKLADVLVVWRHDWAECPIPVVELSSLDVPGG